MTLIALAGSRKSGKTSLAHYMQDISLVYGLEKPEILSFATPLKELFCQLKDISLESLMLSKEQYRVEMQDLSNQIKAEDPLYWTKRILEKIDPNKNQIIDDLRLFETEFLPLLNIKAVIWRVYADKDQRRLRDYIYTREVDESPYERDLDLPQDIYLKLCGTGYIFNNGTLEALREKAANLVKTYFLPSTMEV